MSKKKLKIILYFLLIMCCFQASAYATSQGDSLEIEGLQEEKTELEKNTNIGSLLFRYIVSIFAVIVLTFIGVKYLGSKLNIASVSKEWIQVLDNLSLGSNKGIYLVEIEGKGYVLGVTEHQINIIATIEDDERMDELRKLSLKQSLHGNILKSKKLNFHSYLQKHIKYTHKMYPGKEGEKDL